MFIDLLNLWQSITGKEEKNNVVFYTIRYSNESIQIIRLFGSLPKQMHELRNQVRIYKDLAAVL